MVAIYVILCIYPKFAISLGGLPQFLSFATLVLLYVSVVYAKNALQEQVAARDEERRPFVILSIEEGQGGGYLARLKNIGKLPASDVEITTTPQMQGRYSMLLGRCLPILNEKVSFLPPDAELSFPIAAPEARLDINNTEEFKVIISYRCSVLKSSYSDPPYIIRWPNYDPKEWKELLKRLQGS